DTAESIAQEVWPLPGFPPDVFSDFVAIGQRVGGKTIVDDILPEAIAGFNAADPVERLSLLARGFLKKDGDPYDSGKTFKKLIPDMPDVVERYMHAVSALIAATDRLALFRMVEGTRAALIVADRLIQRYENLKASRGFLDFNDLITRTHRLLSRAEAGAWVQYKLDQGIDHILIDEAQDTSPEQWEVVRALTAEFFVGEGARGDLNRTVFAVGDEKQSIYSFQGASPDAFGQSGELFGQFVR
ncbi:double-strand break repair helicase AddA, partial [Salmonella enterica subsp. enterica serovar Newport]|nr:double-strand break repair helicase AddA [Salmonella enterica subsp. enterica serovar Newport]